MSARVPLGFRLARRAFRRADEIERDHGDHGDQALATLLRDLAEELGWATKRIYDRRREERAA